MGKKILLADDSLTIQKVVEMTFVGTDYELTCVSNGQKALKSLEQSRPDLILADVVMPEKNGYEVCEAVKSNPATAGIPVLLLSGTFEPFDRDRADRIGADRVVSKPFDPPYLLDQIETLLARAAGAVAPAPAVAQEDPSATTTFLDDTIPTARAADRSAAVEIDPFETSSPLPAGESQSLSTDWPSEALPKEEAPAEGLPADTPSETLSEAGEGSSIAEAEPVGAEEFSGGPVFLPTPETRAAPEESETRHPVEEAPAEPPPVEPAAEQAGIEEISAEEAEVLFDVPAAFGSAPPVSPAPAVFELTQEQIERIAALVVAKLSDRVLREIVWEVVPDVAEMVVKRRIEELESGVE